MHVFARESVSFMHDQPGQFATLLRATSRILVVT